MRRAWLVVVFLCAVVGGGCGSGSGKPVAQPTASATSSSPLDLPTSSTSHIDIPSGPPVNPTTAAPTPSRSPTWVECGKLPYESRNHNVVLRSKATPPATCSQARTIVVKAFERLRADDSAKVTTVSGWRCEYLPQFSTPLFNDLHCVKGNLIVDGYIGDPNKPT